LEAESGVRCVPIFWLQTEDHDFAEIRTATVSDGDGQPICLELEDAQPADGRTSVAQRSLPEQVTELLDRLAHIMGGTPAAHDVLYLLRDAYRPGESMADAFACLLATLFADEGLLIFNPRDARVAAQAAPFYRQCIERAEPVEAALRERQAALVSAGFDVQVPIRERGALTFFHIDSSAGQRFRIQRQGSAGIWQLAGSSKTISHEDLLATLATDPLRFSSSALLRPILQDRLFPTAAYVAGPGELNYFAQLGPLYAEANLAPPLLVPRGRFCVVDARARRRLGQLGLSVGDLALPAHEMAAHLKGEIREGVVSADDLRSLVATQIAPAVDRVVGAMDSSDANLHRAAERTRKSIAHAMDRLLTRYALGLLERDTVTQRRLHAVQQALFPSGSPQERFYSWPALAGRIGAGALKQMVLQRLASAPFSTDVHELHS
jgi:bacillithiol biosynthesis cysteine-adding enzyme BshC